MKEHDETKSIEQGESLVREEKSYDLLKQQAIALLEQGFHLGGTIRATRDEWHER